MKTPLQIGASLFAYGQAQTGMRLPAPPEKRFIINHIAGAVVSMAADRTSSEAKDAGGIGMVRYGGTPREFGLRFGELNRESLRRGQPRWLERQNVSREKLLELVRPMVEVVADVAPQQYCRHDHQHPS